MAILETIAAANAAYSVIKTCISNGKETADLMSNVGKFLPLTAITGGSEGDWEEFQHLERIKEQRKELESYIRLYGRPGQWDRWIQWQAEARKQRAAARRAAEKKREEQMEALATAAGIGMAVTVVALGVYYLGVWLEKW
jgi:hypothetical protein